MSAYDDWKTDPDYGRSHRQMEMCEQIAEERDRADRFEAIADELLSALKLFMRHCSLPMTSEMNEIWCKACAAIAKVEGR